VLIEVSMAEVSCELIFICVESVCSTGLANAAMKIQAKKRKVMSDLFILDSFMR